MRNLTENEAVKLLLNQSNETFKINEKFCAISQTTILNYLIGQDKIVSYAMDSNNNEFAYAYLLDIDEYKAS